MIIEIAKKIIPIKYLEQPGMFVKHNTEKIKQLHNKFKGKKWFDPKLNNVLESYKFHKKVFEADGRKIYNATEGGKLELFERVEFTSLFK